MAGGMDAERARAQGAAASRILVMRRSRASIVDLRRLYASAVLGRRVVSLADVWVAAQLPGDLFALTFDFLDDAGARASHAGSPKLESAQFVKGWLDLDTRELLWDESTGVPGHWRVKGVTTILADDVADEESGARPIAAIAKTG